MKLTYFALLFISIFGKTDGFCSHIQQASSHRVSPMLFGTSRDNHENIEQSEIEEMRTLILTMSKEQNDEKRRKDLSDLMTKKVEESRIDEEAKRFLELWDQTLIIVGGEVQEEARLKAMKNPPQENEDKNPKEKSDDELQLWALVDMMVQSKTMVKKAR